MEVSTHISEMWRADVVQVVKDGSSRRYPASFHFDEWASCDGDFEWWTWSSCSSTDVRNICICHGYGGGLPSFISQSLLPEVFVFDDTEVWRGYGVARADNFGGTSGRQGLDDHGHWPCDGEIVDVGRRTIWSYTHSCRSYITAATSAEITQAGGSHASGFFFRKGPITRVSTRTVYQRNFQGKIQRKIQSGTMAYRDGRQGWQETAVHEIPVRQMQHQWQLQVSSWMCLSCWRQCLWKKSWSIGSRKDSTLTWYGCFWYYTWRLIDTDFKWTGNIHITSDSFHTLSKTTHCMTFSQLHDDEVEEFALAQDSTLQTAPVESIPSPSTINCNSSSTASSIQDFSWYLLRAPCPLVSSGEAAFRGYFAVWYPHPFYGWFVGQSVLRELTSSLCFRNRSLRWGFS